MFQSKKVTTKEKVAWWRGPTWNCLSAEWSLYFIVEMNKVFNLFHNSPMCSLHFLIFYLSSQAVVKVPIAEREVNFSVTIGNWTCGDLVVTWKEDWTTDYGIWPSFRILCIIL